MELREGMMGSQASTDDLMNLSPGAVTPSAHHIKLINQTEINQLREQGLCLKCRVRDHMIKSYLFKPPRHPATLMIAKMISKLVLNNDNMDISENSGKRVTSIKRHWKK
ncbi:hypothetical protein PAAG_12061 [Paracoccidioides lutzii Pb01]|uniref:Uncharacterized protein n=1 Tax=Paracoccidioides lutzii (strain ATCC MYA-826 / Pb01) TaxID=502779 RepID=A0A0A2V159_PARBA|nr:hypothetical protein PAAG_12061 [Paracoccidioides lutzii Pb01]KGQ01203.1 hypothetical protein PAAG_12061 [Paracoccidioides lutzii Pb01]